MFDITITGRIAQKKRIKNFVNDVMGHYFGKRLRRNIDLDIIMRRDLEEGQVAGYCYGDKNEIVIELARTWSWDSRKNRVRRPFTHTEMVHTLAHELVHAKQFIRGEITSRLDKWRSKGYTFNCARTGYHNLPWEVEAYKTEDLLLEMYWERPWQDEEA
jgi:hypothetical protein|tara:strand:- start:1862 stop:2338 length:477 start_codon:yes stop_codon:yes gene_type:complete